LKPACDLLCISPHTDDAEIALGGTLALLASRGRRIWLLDLTRGELGSNGTPEQRWEEGCRAAAALGVAGRARTALPDGFIDPHAPDQVAAVAWWLRALRPLWVVTAPVPERHPDHVATPELVRRAVFLARLAAWRPARPASEVWPEDAAPAAAAERWIVSVVARAARPGEAPSLLFDVTAAWEAKQRALAAYASQFRREPGGRATAINDPRFLAMVEDWARAWGARAGCARAEALVTAAVPVLDDWPAGRWA